MEVIIFTKLASVLVLSISVPLSLCLAWARNLGVILPFVSISQLPAPWPHIFPSKYCLIISIWYTSWVCLYCWIYHVYIFKYILNMFLFLFPHCNCPSSSPDQLCLDLPQVNQPVLWLLHNVTKRIFLKYKSSEITPLFKILWWSSSVLRIMSVTSSVGPAWSDSFA